MLVPPAASRLVGDGFDSFFCGLLIAKIIMPGRLEVFIEFIDQRNACGYIQFQNVLFTDTVEMFDQSSQAVAVRADQYIFPCFDGRHDLIKPIRQEPVDSMF